MKKSVLLGGLALVMILSACSTAAQVNVGEAEVIETPVPTATTTPTPTPTPEPTPTPYTGPTNPLTGEPMDEELTNNRPVAIMLNNLKVALPQQGQSQADIIYEVLVEGAITRMMGVYQDTTGIEKIGAIRSSRTYYLELALGHDAIYIHAGGSEDAYTNISAWGVASLDGVRGNYMSNTDGENLMWRDSERLKTSSLEHTVVTTGDTIVEKLASYTNLRRELADDYTYEMLFTEDGTPEGGGVAEEITVPFSSYKTGLFHYDSEIGKYYVDEYGEAYIDGNTGDQVAVTNVIIIETACTATYDALDHINVDLHSGGTGYFACGGSYIPITWSKSYPDGQLVYTMEDGTPLTLGQGNSYVNIVPLNCAVTFE